EARPIPLGAKPSVKTASERLRPTDAGCRRVADEDLARYRLYHVIDSFGAAPVRGHHEQRPTVGAAEHGCEAGAAEIDLLEHLATLADTGAVVRHVCARGPDAAVRVEADAVGADTVCPHAPIRQVAVSLDVEGGEACGKGLGDDERLIVRRYDHAVREGQLVG